ncbi:MAG: hypothetical protein MSL49_09520, partial [Lactobacillus johnsonii]|nr:hypothetical protein [Lactobacillus johnsonii]
CWFMVECKESILTSNRKFLWLLTFYQTGPNGLFIFYQVFNLILQSAIIIFLILGGFEGVVNGIILGQFPNLVDASSNKLILFLIQSSGIFCIVYTALVLKNILLNYARKILRVSLKKLCF